VRRHDVPFQLMPGDFEPSDSYDGGPPASSADTFDHEIVGILGWMVYLEGPIPGKPIKEGREELAQIHEHEEALPEVFAGHTIHLFMYNHQQYDCSYSEQDSWSKRNPTRTTAKSTLWL
jgi:hypothetical protein